MNAVISRKWTDYAIGFFSLAAWITLFGAGLMIDSLPYRKNLVKSFNWFDFVLAASVFTYTNVAILTCISGVIGGIASRLTFQRYQTKISNNGGSENQPVLIDSVSISYRIESPMASMCRSFLVYLLYIAGLSIGVPEIAGETEPFGHTTFGQYIRMSGLLSLLGFAVGYDPTLFQTLFSRIHLPIIKKADD